MAKLALTEVYQTILYYCQAWITESTIAYGQITLEIKPDYLKKIALALRDMPNLQFNMLIDLCGVDYLEYGHSEWITEKASYQGFSRGVEDNQHPCLPWSKPRFAVVYHLLSLETNQRLRLKVYLDEASLILDSVISIWPAANWYEREAFDLFGIAFKNHPDLRRILTDYGFVGYPFRKDFPLSGHVEMRYDATEERVIYEPVSIEPRTLVPKVFRADNRYHQIGDDHA